MQKVRRHPFPRRGIGLRPLVGTWFQVLFTPLDGVLFTIQSPYWFTIGRWRVLSLGGWAPLLHTEFHEHRATLGHRTEGLDAFRLRGFHPLWRTFPGPSARPAFLVSVCPGPQPRAEARFGLFRVRSPLLAESQLLSSPPGTEMFQFPGLAPTAYTFSRRCAGSVARPTRVAPFGNPGINAWLAATPGLSQPPTPFIAFQRLGIHHAPLVA